MLSRVVPILCRLCLALPIALTGALGACGEDKADGLVDPTDTTADGLLEILLPDSTPDTATTTAPDTSTSEDSGDETDGAPCTGCTGAPCDDNGDCNSGYCLEGPNGKECVRTCQDECPTGYACRGVQDAGGDPIFLCLYEHIAFCAPCNVDGDCETGIGGATGAKCLPGDDAAPGDGRFCRTPCTPGTCPTGATCVETSVGEETLLLCRAGTANEQAACTCSARSVALTLGTDCALTNAFGTCDGERICAAVGPVPACDATPAAAEACNDKDDDCDGDTDEDFDSLGAECDGEDADLCKGGVTLCAPDGTLGCTDDANSDVERCDAIDNDCDGETDEDFADVGMACDGPDPDSCKDGVMACDGLGIACNDGPDTETTGTELCNGVDDNCNTTVDEGFEDKNQPCDGDDADGCKEGTFQCGADGLSLVCNDDAATRVELCNELDDDCQNGPDDTFPDKLLPCDGPDADNCPDGVSVCAPDQLSLACTDDGVSKIEVCNDLDDDCDGQTDEDFPLKGEACDSEVDADVCADGEWVCSANALVCSDDATAAIETCNGNDDDCDGLTDQMDGDLADALNPNQLGACAGSVQACAGASGYVPDYSAVAGFGQPETPNASYLDENCDGLDGDEARAVFVAPNQPSSGSCTKASPCGSVTYAITQTSSTRPHVYVQAGTYTEVVEVPSGANIAIYGGFNASWVRKARSETGHKVTLKGVKHNGDGEYVAVRVRNATVVLGDLVVQAPSPGSEERKNGQGLSSYGIHATQSTVTLERVEVLQGNGASGDDGSNGVDAPSLSAPAKAEKGGAGDQEINVCDDSTSPGGASGRTNSQCSTGTAGGEGGDGGKMDTGCDCAGFCIDGVAVCECTATDGTDGTDGSGSARGLGSDGGSGGSSCGAVDPGGPGGTPGHGTGGEGGSRGGGLSSSYWYGDNGGDGTTGQHGSGGGGGGGSGGCDEGDIPFQNSTGSGGGGGGAGGCAAQQGGRGGKSGGSSFGLFAVGGTITVRDSRFVLGNGGPGGRGGAGGLGQPGGAGGDGGDASGDSKAGGDGGKGGDGGASGGGGGGGGGNAFGVYTQNSSVDVGGTNDFSGGAAGPRGEAGDAAAVAGSSGDGKPGQIGRVESVSTCASANDCGD